LYKTTLKRWYTKHKKEIGGHDINKPISKRKRVYLFCDEFTNYNDTAIGTLIGALVNTTLHNVAETSRVRILVNGEPAETLGGHVDLTRPLLFLKDIVATPDVEPEITPPGATDATGASGAADAVATATPKP